MPLPDCHRPPVSLRSLFDDPHTNCAVLARDRDPMPVGGERCRPDRTAGVRPFDHLRCLRRVPYPKRSFPNCSTPSWATGAPVEGSQRWIAMSRAKPPGNDPWLLNSPLIASRRDPNRPGEHFNNATVAGAPRPSRSLQVSPLASVNFRVLLWKLLENLS
jgi:hypothetical protein